MTDVKPQRRIGDAGSACLARLLLLLACFWVVQPTFAREPNTLTIGMFAYRPVTVLEPAWRPLTWYLQEHVPGIFVNIRFLDHEAMALALKNDELDLVFTNPVHFITLRSQNTLSGAIATLVALEDGQPVSQLGGVVIRRRERTDIKSLQDLVGKVVAIIGTRYLGGYAAQLHELAKRGIHPDSIDFKWLGKTHDDIIDAVLDGDVDAGFVRSGILESLQRSGHPRIQELEVVEPLLHPRFPFKVSTALYPEWAVVALPHLDPNISRRISAALLALEPDDTLSQLAGIHGFAIPSDYQPVQEAMIVARMPPFDRAPIISLSEFAHQHAVSVVAAGMIMLTLLIATVWVSRTNRQMRVTQASLAQEHQRLEYIIEGTNAGTWEWDLTTDQLVVGGRWAEMLGYRLEDFDAASIETWKEMTHPADRQRALTIAEASFATGATTFESEFRMRHKLGHWVWIQSLGRMVRRADDGAPLLLTGIHLDVSQRKREEEERVLSHSVFMRTHTGVMVTDDCNRIMQVNPAFTEITGYTRDEVLGKNPDLLSSGAHDPSFYDAIWVSLQTTGEWNGEVTNRHKDGHVFSERLSISVIHDPEGGVAHYIAVFTDISLQKQLMVELQHTAHHDQLTGLANRALLHDRLSLAVAQARRSKISLAVIFLDLDGFKPVNDTHGHNAGDALLKVLSLRMRELVRDGDTVARLGGDEFVVVANAVVDEVNALACAQRIFAALCEPVMLETAHTHVSLSASVGVIYCAADRLDPSVQPSRILLEADAAMYAAKQAGKANIVVRHLSRTT